MRLLSMPNQASQLFRANKCLEARIEHVACTRLLNDWLRALPRHHLCLWKQFSQQLILAAHNDVHDTITNSILPGGTEVEGVDASVSVGLGEEFNVAIHCLAG